MVNAIPQMNGMASKILFFVFALDDKVDDSRGCHNNDNYSENNGSCFVLVGGDRIASQCESVETSRKGDCQSSAEA